MSLSIEKAMSLAKAHEKKREFEQARHVYMAVLKKFPKNARARKALDALGGPVQEGQIIDLPQNEAGMLVTLFQQGNFAQVVEAARAMAASHSASAFLWDISGLANAYMGRFAEAEQCFLRELKIRPDYADAYNNLGLVLHAQRRLYDAQACFRQALSLRPYVAEVHNNLAKTLRDLGDYDGAVRNCSDAIDLEPGYVEAHCTLAGLYYGRGKFEQAVSHCERALALQPGNPEALTKLGTIYSAWGRFAEARDCYAKCMETNPAHAVAYLLFADIHTFEKEDPLLAGMEAAAASPSLSDDDRMNIGFARAKAYADVNETDRAFGLFSEANRLRKTMLGYDLAFDESLFAEVRATFPEPVDTAEIQQAAPARTRHVPVFIVGMPRSGTTLVEQIVAGHPQVHTAGELDDLARTIGAMRQEYPDDRAAMFKGVREGYLQSLEGLGASERFVIDKMPLNFRWIGYIACAFPEARIVNMVRDPRAVCWSNFRHCFGGYGNGFSYDLEDVARYHALYSELMDFWRSRFPGRIHDVDYRAFTEDPEMHGRDLFGFLGLEWRDDYLDFHKRKTMVRTVSKAQVRRGIYTGSSESWRRYEAHLQPMLRILDEAGLT